MSTPKWVIVGFVAFYVLTLCLRVATGEMPLEAATIRGAWTLPFVILVGWIAGSILNVALSILRALGRIVLRL